MPNNPLIARLYLEFQRMFTGMNIPPKMTIKLDDLNIRVASLF